MRVDPVGLESPAAAPPRPARHQAELGLAGPRPRPTADLQPFLHRLGRRLTSRRGSPPFPAARGRTRGPWPSPDLKPAGQAASSSPVRPPPAAGSAAPLPLRGVAGSQPTHSSSWESRQSRVATRGAGAAPAADTRTLIHVHARSRTHPH